MARLPQELIDEVVDYLSTDRKTLQQCARAARSLRRRAHKHLFRSVEDLYSDEIVQRLVDIIAEDPLIATYIKGISSHINQTDIHTCLRPPLARLLSDISLKAPNASIELHMYDNRPVPAESADWVGNEEGYYSHFLQPPPDILPLANVTCITALTFDCVSSFPYGVVAACTSATTLTFKDMDFDHPENEGHYGLVGPNHYPVPGGLHRITCLKLYRASLPSSVISSCTALKKLVLHNSHIFSDEHCTTDERDRPQLEELDVDGYCTDYLEYLADRVVDLGGLKSFNYVMGKNTRNFDAGTVREKVLDKCALSLEELVITADNLIYFSKNDETRRGFYNLSLFPNLQRLDLVSHCSAEDFDGTSDDLETFLCAPISTLASRNRSLTDIRIFVLPRVDKIVTVNGSQYLDFRETVAPFLNLWPEIWRKFNAEVERVACGSSLTLTLGFHLRVDLSAATGADATYLPSNFQRDCRILERGLDNWALDTFSAIQEAGITICISTDVDSY